MPAGWTPKSTAPAAFDMGEALGALITGQSDSWLSAWLHLLGGELLSTANFCTNVDLNPPALALDDFLGGINVPTGIIGAGVGADIILYGLRQKVAAYAAARIGSAYCEHFVGGTGETCVTVFANVVPGSDEYFNGAYPGDNIVPAAGTTRIEWSTEEGPIGQLTMQGSLGGVYVSAIAEDSGALNQAHAYKSWNWPKSGFDGYRIYSNAAGKHFNGKHCSPGSMVGQAPAPQAPVANLPAPVTNVYTTIPDLGAELDTLEHKVEFLRDMVLYLVQHTAPPNPPGAGDTSLTTVVNLLQRQLAPFAYITGAVHADRLGTGEIDVSGILGVKILVTAYPAGNRALPGEPPYIYDLGWLSAENADGLIVEKRITSTTQVWTPREMSEATRVGYYLRAGVTATITELLREP